MPSSVLRGERSCEKRKVVYTFRYKSPQPKQAHVAIGVMPVSDKAGGEPSHVAMDIDIAACGGVDVELHQ